MNISLTYSVSTFSLLLLPTPHKTKERLLQVEIMCENNSKFSSQIYSYSTTFQSMKADFNHKTQKSEKRGFNWTLDFFDCTKIQKGCTADSSLENITAINSPYLSSSTASKQGYPVKQALHTISRLCSIGYPRSKMRKYSGSWTSYWVDFFPNPKKATCRVSTLFTT